MASIEKESVATPGDAIARISHRINNVLQAINGGSHLVEMGLNKNDLSLVAKGWEIVRRNQIQISQQVMNLLILSKPYEANRETCDLRHIVKRTVETLAATFEFEQIDVALDLGEPECIVQVDCQAMPLLLENLLGVVVRAVRTLAERFCRITVTDRVDEIEINVEYGGIPTRSKPVGGESSTADRDEQEIGGIEVDVANKIASGHAGKIIFSADPAGFQRISISIPKK